MLECIPDPIFEVLGILTGLTTCVVISVQWVKEIRDRTPSTMSLFFVFGWAAVFGIWTLYGLRFELLAVWLTNAIALVLQLGMIITVLLKRSKHF